MAWFPADEWRIYPAPFDECRYGTARQLMSLIDKLHNAGIGAILDFVPVHFAVDAYGLKEFDGTALYEYPHTDVGESEWGSYNFMHSPATLPPFGGMVFARTKE